jgi:hypothetical protein
MTEYTDQELDCRHGDIIKKSAEWRSLFTGEWKRKTYFVYRFRAEPIPSTGRRHWHKGSYYRNPPHRPMLRALVRAVEDGVAIRQKYKDVPNPWEDYPRLDRKIRNWKKFRKTQYK